MGKNEGCKEYEAGEAAGTCAESVGKRIQRTRGMRSYSGYRGVSAQGSAQPDQGI